MLEAPSLKMAIEYQGCAVKGRESKENSSNVGFWGLKRRRIFAIVSI
jgi:hypothetical protein